MGLAEKTSPEMLKSVFEGAVNARVTVNKKDVSKRSVVRSCLFTVLTA